MLQIKNRARKAINGVTFVRLPEIVLQINAKNVHSSMIYLGLPLTQWMLGPNPYKPDKRIYRKNGWEKKMIMIYNIIS